MVEKVKPEVPITLDKERHLRLDMNAMVAFEEATGESLLSAAAQKKLTDQRSIKYLRAFLWACLLHEEETLTLKQVGGWIHTGNMADVYEQIGKAWSNALPEADGAAVADPLP